MAQSIHWGHVEVGQFTFPHFFWQTQPSKQITSTCAQSYARKTYPELCLRVKIKSVSSFSRSKPDYPTQLSP